MPAADPHPNPVQFDPTTYVGRRLSCNLLEAKDRRARDGRSSRPAGDIGASSSYAKSVHRPHRQQIFLHVAALDRSASRAVPFVFFRSSHLSWPIFERRQIRRSTASAWFDSKHPGMAKKPRKAERYLGNRTSMSRDGSPRKKPGATKHPEKQELSLVFGRRDRCAYLQHPPEKGLRRSLT